MRKAYIIDLWGVKANIFNALIYLLAYQDNIQKSSMIHLLLFN